MSDTAATMPECFGEDLMVSGHRYPLEQMIFSELQRGPGRFKGGRAAVTLVAQAGERTSLLRSQTLALAYTHFFGRDLNQLVGARFADENGNFVIGRLASFFGNKLVNGIVTLPAAPAVFGEKFIGYPANLEPTVAAHCVSAILDLVSEPPHLVSKGVTVHLREVRSPLIDSRCLQRFPSAFCAVVREISGHRMGVKLGIEFAARVMLIDCNHEISGRPVTIRPSLPHTSGGVGLQLLKGFGNGLCVCVYESFVSSQDGH